MASRFGRGTAALATIACLAGCGSTSKSKTTADHTGPPKTIQEIAPNEPAVGALNVDLHDTAATFVVIAYRTPGDAIGGVQPGEAAGIKAGRGLMEIAGTFVFLLGVNSHLTAAERGEFQHAYAAAEGK
jgi:hypothetical protein